VGFEDWPTTRYDYALATWVSAFAALRAAPSERACRLHNVKRALHIMYPRRTPAARAAITAQTSMRELTTLSMKPSGDMILYGF
jgi:hypothetical protein